MRRRWKPDLLFWAVVALLVALALVMAWWAGAQAATIRYVHGDSPCPGDGSAQAPYCRLQAAVDAAQCGDVLRVRATQEPYSEPVLITRPTCSPATPVFLEPDRDQEMLWRPRKTPGNDVYALALRDVDGWVVRGLTLQGSAEQPRYGIQVQAYSRSVTGVVLTGNRVTDWNVATRYANTAAMIVHGNPTAGHAVHGIRITHNTVERFRTRALQVSHSQRGYVAHNTLTGGVCGPTSAGGTVNMQLIGAHTHTSVPESVAQAFGDLWERNRLHDFETPEACMAAQGTTARPLVHGFWCHGVTDGVFRSNELFHIGRGAAATVRVVRVDTGCHRWRVQLNALWDNGGTSLMLSGATFDAQFLGNHILRPAEACLLLSGTQPRRVLLRENLCSEPGTKPLTFAGGFAAEQVTQVGNSWPAAP